MGEFSIWHWLIVIVIVLLLFGRGKISGVMGDVAQGIKAFKKGIADDGEAAPKKADAGQAIDQRESAEVPPRGTAQPTESSKS